MTNGSNSSNSRPDFGKYLIPGMIIGGIVGFLIGLAVSSVVGRSGIYLTYGTSIGIVLGLVSGILWGGKQAD